MGHLINSTALRIGWTYVWEDIMYISSLYYSEFLHFIFNLKKLCWFWFTRKKLENSSFFCSNFFVYKLNKVLYIHVNFYYGKFFEFLNMLNFVFHEKFKFFMKNKINLSLSFKFFQKYVFGFFIYLISSIIFKNSTYQKLRNLNKFLIKTTDKTIKTHINALSVLKNKFYKHKEKIYKVLDYKFSNFVISLAKTSKISLLNLFFKTFRSTFFIRKPFWFMFIIRLIFYKLDKKLNIKKIYKIFSKIMQIFYWENLAKSLKVDKFFFETLLKLKFPMFNIVLNLYLIKNEQVSPQFISRFFAKKLSYGYSIKELVYPIKKNLNTIIKKGVISKGYLKQVLVGSELKNDLWYSKNLFKFLIKFVYVLFNKNINKFNKLVGSFLIDDSIIIFEKLKKISNKSKIQGFCKAYLKSKYLISFLLNVEFKHNVKNLITPIKNKLFVRLLNIYNLCYQSFLYFSQPLFKNLYLNKGMFLFDSNIVFITNKFLYQILLYKYFFFNYNLLDFCKKFTEKVKLRSRLLGFKFQFLGRFQRKQRAANIIYKVGALPLNTISSYIKFSNYTIPIVNSSVNIKVWFYYNKKDLQWSNFLVA